jgi:hypothetical protein
MRSTEGDEASGGQVIHPLKGQYQKKHGMYSESCYIKLLLSLGPYAYTEINLGDFLDYIDIGIETKLNSIILYT